MSEVRMPTQKRSIEKKEKIIEKGFELMCKNGYYNTNTNDIAKYAEVSTGIIYQYFNDKKEIFIEGVKNYSDNIMFPMLDVLKRKDKKFDNLEETLDEILDIFIKKHTLTKKAHEEMIALSHQDEDIAEIFHSKEITMTKQIVEVLREKGLAAAAKKAGRVAAEGIVKTFISEDMKKGAMVEVNCETDFVADNAEFIEFAGKVAEMAANNDVSTVEELVALKYNDDKTVQEVLTELIAKIGENMTVRRFEKVAVENGVVQSYIHGGGRIGVLVQLACDSNSSELTQVAKDVCMQIAAANPLFLSENEVDSKALETEKEIYRAQALNEGKPEKIVEKMVEGRIKKYYKEVCLLNQPWVKDADKSISKYLEEKSKEVGSPITVQKYFRFERGEGIEKKEENFAEEVAKMGAK